MASVRPMAMAVVLLLGVVAPAPAEDAKIVSGSLEPATTSENQCAEPGTGGSSLIHIKAHLQKTMESAEDGCNTLQWTAHPTKCLDVAFGSTANGANIQIYDCIAGEPNQAFLLPTGGEGPVRWAAHPTKCLDVAAGRASNGNNIQLWDCVDDEPNQRFVVLDGSPGTLQWASQDFCIDVSGGATHNTNNVQIWRCREDSANQRFSAPSATCPGGSPEPSSPTEAPSSSTEACCETYDGWPGVDRGVTCGDACTALVLVDGSNGGRCDRYCESFGHVCVAAAEEMREDCEVKYTASCSQPIQGTSDMLCTCRRPTATDDSLCPAVPGFPASTSPSPSSATTTGALPSSDPSSRVLRVMSYNTEYRGYPSRVSNYGRKISDVDAAVVGTQENQDKAALARASGYSVVPDTGFQNPIYYHPSKVSYVAGSGGWRAVQRDNYAERTITWAQFRLGGSSFWHFNTHLPHNHGQARSRNTHARIARTLLQIRTELGASDVPTVVTGDMNPFASNGNTEGSFESTLVAAGFHLAYVGRGNTGGYAGLDKILASWHWSSSNGADRGTGSSDHPAIAVDLTLRAQR